MSKASISAFAITIVIVLAVAGCGTGQERNEQTVRSTAVVPVDVDRTKQALDQTQTALKKLRDAGDNTDLKRLYADVKMQDMQLNDDLATVESRSREAVDSGRVQATQWHQEAESFTEKDLRDASNKRELELRQSVDELATASENFRNVSGDYRKEMSQLLAALDLDLSQAGLKSVKPEMSRVVDNESNLRKALNEVATKSKSVNEVLSR